jgi:hypothetical protein
MSLEQVRERFEEWRATREKRGRVPEELWDAAVDLTDRHSICVVSKTLRLDFNGLKQRVHKKRHGAETGFIAFDLRPVSDEAECTIEMERPDGARMRVRLRGSAGLDLAQMLRGFWSRS